MNINNDIRDKLIELMKKSINHYNNFKRYEWVVKPAIPILFFGNLIDYLNSEVKIITVALNPSDKEFPESEHRFSFESNKLNQDDALKTLETLSNYFEFNPYNNWFNKHTERILNELDASYYLKKSIKNRALNTDLCTPLATRPTWSKLKVKLKQEKETLNLLMKEGFQIWLDLMKILKPNIILISVAKDYLISNNFIKVSKLKINPHNIYTFGYDDVLEEFKKEKKSLTTKDIYFYQHSEIHNCMIYQGRNNTGTPFGMIRYKENGNDNLKEIREVSKLIQNHLNA
jgi:hypothetical protein